VIEAYLRTIEIVNANIERSPKLYKALKEKAISYADKCLNCDLLDSLYSNDFEKNQNDTLWLDGGIDLLSEKKCYKSEILVKMMEKRFETSPAAKTAIVLAKYFRNKQNNPKANEYFNSAIELEKDSSKLIKHILKKARFQNSTNNYSDARSTANKALKLNRNSAEALLIIGNSIIYGSGSCKDLKFSGAEVFWVAVDYFNRSAAISDDSDIKAKALKKAAKYSAYFPTQNAIFLQSLNPGDKYQVGCWVNSSTTIREKK
jgi:tetratricopeptide (TPR) repeat protein